MIGEQAFGGRDMSGDKTSISLAQFQKQVVDGGYNPRLGWPRPRRKGRTGPGPECHGFALSDTIEAVGWWKEDKAKKGKQPFLDYRGGGR
jgi:hypothetical protein